jgi:hypothetical protein
MMVRHSVMMSMVGIGVLARCSVGWKDVPRAVWTADGLLVDRMASCWIAAMDESWVDLMAGK